MAIKIGNIGSFTLFPAGVELVLPAEERRRVRLEVNCEAPTRFDVALQGGELVFLARVEGRAAVEFVVAGPCSVIPTSEGEVWLNTDEGAHIVYETGEPSFVTLDFERAPEMTEHERLMAIANLKREQREADAMALLDAKLAKLEALAAEEADDAQEPDDNAGGGEAASRAGVGGEAEQAGEGQDTPAGSA